MVARNQKRVDLYALSRAIDTVMPITEMVHAVLYEGKEIEPCVSELMTRGATDEIAETTWRN